MIGAGFAGMAAARRLQRASVDVIVLEARDRVGGRVTSDDVGGLKVDGGGQYLGSDHKRMLALAAEFGIAVFPTHTAGENLHEDAWGMRRYQGNFPTHEREIADALRTAIEQLDALARGVRPDEPWQAAGADGLDGQTVATWLRETVEHDGARAFMHLVCQTCTAVDPADVSLLYFLSLIAACGGTETMFGTDGGLQALRLEATAGELAARLGRTLGESLRLATPVEAIDQTGEDLRIRAADGFVVQAQAAIVAMSPALASRLAISPAPSAARDQLMQRVPNGTALKSVAVYDTPFWREDGLSGEVTSCLGPPGWVYDNSPADATVGMLVAFTTGRSGLALSTLDKEARRGAVLESFTRWFGSRASTPRGFADWAWSQERYSRGCYAGVFPPGCLTSVGPVLRCPDGRIYWAGTESARESITFMDGACESGERAADQVLQRLGGLVAAGGATQLRAE